jgi:hypothetical protein
MTVLPHFPDIRHRHAEVSLGSILPVLEQEGSAISRRSGQGWQMTSVAPKAAVRRNARGRGNCTINALNDESLPVWPATGLFVSKLGEMHFSVAWAIHHVGLEAEL